MGWGDFIEIDIYKHGDEIYIYPFSVAKPFEQSKITYTYVEDALKIKYFGLGFEEIAKVILSQKKFSIFGKIASKKDAASSFGKVIKDFGVKKLQEILKKGVCCRVIVNYDNIVVSGWKKKRGGWLFLLEGCDSFDLDDLEGVGKDILQKLEI